tara:strand:+ start:448 stop:777 length:330 start_codon:yes stop_codon:yes gene_type:complete
MFALYWAMAVTLGIGMDIHPYTMVETFFTVFFSAMGVFMFAFIVGSASSSLAQLDAMGQQQRNRVETIQHFMRYRKACAPPRPHAPHAWLRSRVCTPSLSLRLSLRRCR